MNNLHFQNYKIFLLDVKNYIEKPEYDGKVIKIYSNPHHIWYVNKNIKSKFKQYWKDGLFLRPNYKEAVEKAVKADNWTGEGLFFRFTPKYDNYSTDDILSTGQSWPIPIETTGNLLEELARIEIDILEDGWNKLIVYSGPYMYCPENYTEDLWDEIWSSASSTHLDPDSFNVAWSLEDESVWVKDFDLIDKNESGDKFDDNPLKSLIGEDATLIDLANYIREHLESKIL